MDATVVLSVYNLKERYIRNYEQWICFITKFILNQQTDEQSAVMERTKTDRKSN